MLRLRTVLRNIFLVAVLIATVFAFVGVAVPGVMAQGAQDSLEDVGQEAGIDTGVTLYETIGLIINVFFGILGIIFLILVIYSGVLWMTAGGRPEQIDKAKKILVQAVIGLVITLSAFAIASFIVNAIGNATGVIGPGSGGDVSIEIHSGSLGSGVIRDHYPARSATDVPRNTKIFVTFREEMNPASFIEGYDADETATGLNADNIKIYATADGADLAFPTEDVTVAFTEDQKTFVFDPPILGSATEDVNYSVSLSDEIENTDGETPINLGGYLWTFTVGTELDLTPPEVQSVIPLSGGEFDRNIVVQIDFNEAVDPTSATGFTDEGFENIQVSGDGEVVSGVYETSNGYKTITFIPSDACGTNSCGETIYCLPGDAEIIATIYGATPSPTDPPQAEGFPYDGIVDVVGNSLDGDGDWGEPDGEVGDSYIWNFSTTNDVNLSSPEVFSITPNILEEDVDLDQDVIMVFGCENSANPALCNSIMMSSTLNSDNITITSDPEHELWYSFTKQDLTSDYEVVDDPEDIPAATEVNMSHGIFLESTDDVTYQYRLNISDGVRNQYQNCFVPGEGPNAVGGTCGTSESEPYCCDGVPRSSACPEL